MKFKSKPFTVEANDPLAKEHQLVSNWLEDATKETPERYYFHQRELKSLPSGELLLSGDPEQSRRFVMAAIAQADYWEKAADDFRASAGNQSIYQTQEWRETWGRCQQAQAAIKALMRRTLPFKKEDLICFANWMCGGDLLSVHRFPIGAFTRALSRFKAENTFDSELLDAVRVFAKRIRESNYSDTRKYAVEIERVIIDNDEPTHIQQTERMPRPKPALAGLPKILTRLKQLLGMPTDDSQPTTTELEPDFYPLFADSPLVSEHQLLSEFFRQRLSTQRGYEREMGEYDAGKKLLAMDPSAKFRAILAAAERHIHLLLPQTRGFGDQGSWQYDSAAINAVSSLLGTDARFDRAEFFDLLLYLSAIPTHERNRFFDDEASAIDAAVEFDSESPLTEGERFVMSLFRASLVTGSFFGALTPELQKLNGLIKDGEAFFLVPSDAWAKKVNTHMEQASPIERSRWAALLRHAVSATTSRPSNKWINEAKSLVEAVGSNHVQDALLQWLPLVSKSQAKSELGRCFTRNALNTEVFDEENANCLRGLLWCVPLLPKWNEIARDVTSTAISAYKKIPGVGPRAVKVGNAAVYALSQMPSKESVGQLAMLKVRVRFGSAQKEIEKAFNAAAEALGLPRDQIEELGVPTYGLEEVGRMNEEFGGYRAELHVTGSDAELKWFGPSGKGLKSVPAKVKSEFKDDLKELQQSLKDIQSMLPAQRDRIDGMFLSQKSWPIDEWRERYLDHPLVGTIARRLLWCVDGTAAIFENGTPINVKGEAIAHGKTAEITLWHPVGRDLEDVVAWRKRLEEMKITQPFKQAHREVYLLTEAERNTRTYSNRFAAHIIRQHQFNALCAARGWKNKLRLMVDDEYPPATKEFPQWGLRAEFWVEGIGDEYGADTNDSGVYLRLATDQVRFYRIGAAVNSAHAGGGGYGSRAAGPGDANINEPITLEDVPPLVLSEVLRDVDLFVGVASVGNDPTWQDGGPEGRYQTYWQSYSFGELSGTASTRKQVLERLVPRLKIASRCSFSDRFLVVRGDKRTYKIHLGSGNILMEPNDQYLCIVPDSRARSAQSDLYLPFEGDATLSIIISKAFLLAEDAKIKDPTITQQIGR